MELYEDMLNNLDYEIDLITNFQRSEKEIYEEVIKLSGHSELYITDDATDVYGNRLPFLLALRTRQCKDLSDFWRIYDEVKEGKFGED